MYRKCRLTMIPNCLYIRKLCIFSGPRMYLSRFCILGGRIPDGNCGTLSTTLSLARSGNSISDDHILNITSNKFLQHLQ